MTVAVLCGGVGAARFLRGLAGVHPPTATVVLESAQVSGGASKVGVGPSMIVIFSGGLISDSGTIILPSRPHVTGDYMDVTARD